MPWRVALFSEKTPEKTKQKQKQNKNKNKTKKINKQRESATGREESCCQEFTEDMKTCRVLY